MLVLIRIHRPPPPPHPSHLMTIHHYDQSGSLVILVEGVDFWFLELFVKVIMLVYNDVISLTVLSSLVIGSFA